MAKPTVLTLTLATLPGRYGDGRGGWVSADEVRNRLALFGIVASSQAVVGALQTAAGDDQPCIEARRHESFAFTVYRVTRYGLGEVNHRLGSAVRLYTPWIPTMRGEG
jgi:hypothetical protein